MAELIARDHFIVYEFDNVGKTALRWVAKREFPETAKLLIKKWCQIDAKDSGGRTSLFLSCKFGNLDVAKVLLTFRTNPGSKSSSGENLMKVCSNGDLFPFLKLALLLQICIQLIPVRKRA